MVNDSKEIVSSRYNRVGSLMNSWMLWQNAQDLHNFKLDRIPAWRKGRDTKSRPNQKAIYICWERENQCFLMGCHSVYQPHSRAGPMTRSSWSMQNRHQIFVCIYFFILFGIFYLINCCLFWFSVLEVLFLFYSVLFERKKKQEAR